MEMYQSMLPQIMLRHYVDHPDDKTKYCVLFGTQVMASFDTAEEALAMQEEAASKNKVMLFVVSPVREF